MTAADWEGIAAIVTAVLTGVPAIIIALRSSSAAKQAASDMMMSHIVHAHNDLLTGYNPPPEAR
jgi:spore maturation protein SpmA